MLQRTVAPEPGEEKGEVMTSRWSKVLVAGMGLSCALAMPGRAEEKSTDDLMKEIESLKTLVLGIQKDLQDVKGMLAKQAPPTTGVGVVLDLGGAPVRGEKTAKLTLVEFSDYQ
jgi:hypothetical protein